MSEASATRVRRGVRNVVVVLVGIALATVAGAAMLRPAAAPRTHTVDIRLFKYEPAVLTVHAGDTIVWVNHDVVPHTATDTAKAWDTGLIAAGARGRVVADVAGEHEYLCAYHPEMRGRLVVRE